MKKVYGGKLTLEVYTVVDACNDLTQERNNAHEDCDFDFFRELRLVAERQGLYVNFVGADLHLVEDVSEGEIDLIHRHKTKMKELKKQGKQTRTIRIQF